MRIPEWVSGERRGLLSNRSDYLEPLSAKGNFKGGSIVDLLNFFDVENSLRYSKRWIEGKDGKQGKWATYCEEYVGAVLYEASGRYLIPHSIGWASEAVEKRVLAGEDVPIVLYPKPGEERTVREYGARSVHAWLKKWGAQSQLVMADGKTRGDADGRLREEVTNRGTLGLISTPTHIALVLPDGCMEPTRQQAGRKPFSTTPLQSQAGSSNAKAWYYDKWYANQKSVVRAYVPRELLVNIR